MKTQHVGAWLLAGLLWVPAALQAQVGIGTVSPRPTAILDLSTNSRGFLPPRLTTAEKDALATVLTTAAAPQDLGMMVYDREKLSLLVWNGKTFASPGGSFALPFSAVETASAGTPLFRITNTGNSPIGLFELSSGTGDPSAYALSGQNNQPTGGVGILGHVTNGASDGGIGVQGIAASAKSYGGVFVNEVDGTALYVSKGQTLLSGRLGVGTTTPGAQVDIQPPKGTAALGIQANRDGGSAAIITNNTAGGASSTALNAIALGGTTDNTAARFTTPFPGNTNTGVSIVSQNALLSAIGINLDVAAAGPSATITGVHSKVTQSGSGLATAYYAEAIGAGAFSFYAPSGNVYVGKRLGIQTETPGYALEVAGDVKLGTNSTPFSNMLYGRRSVTVGGLPPGGSSTTGLAVTDITTAHYVVVIQRSVNPDIVITFSTVTTSGSILINIRNFGSTPFTGTVEIAYMAIAP